jgi:excisionase family DNA binding protein
MTDQATSDDQLLVTPEEAARRLSLGRTTIYELMASGELQSVNVGRCRRVPVSELCSFVARLVDVTVGQRWTAAPRLLEQPRGYDWPQRLARATVRRAASAERVASDETPALLPLPRVESSRNRRG